MRRTWKRWFLRAALVVPLLAAGIALAATLLVRGSLPRLDGRATVDGLSAPVSIERDELGVPRIRAASRVDAAAALGYLHAQDRFFQMDLLRRRAAGELSALLGPSLLPTDRGNRIHGFRALADSVVEGASDDQRALLRAYTRGVNAGLADLRVRPVEYLLLRQKPRAWTERDCALAIFAMHLELSLDSVYSESAIGLVHDLLPRELAEFLTPTGNPFEAPLIGEPGELVAWPGREAPASKAAGSAGAGLESQTEPQDRAGSNNWAVSGAHTRDGRALLENDMHLGLGLPNIWYRAQWEWPDAAGRGHRVVGVTLPGAPALVVGSNGHVAWGFTNSYGDFADLIVLEVDPADSTRYRTAEGLEPFGRRRELIEVAGGAVDTLLVRTTRWGPVFDRDHAGRLRALRWTAHELAATNLDVLGLEDAEDVDEAVAVAARCGIPPQNFLCADADGRIAWTIIGRIPQRQTNGVRTPLRSDDAGIEWEGFSSAEEQPLLVDPAEGRLWTANARVVDGDMLAKLGDGGYALGARARQIRDDLRELDVVDETALLGVALDDRALFLSQWRDELLAFFERSAELSADARAFRRWITESWDGHASIESVGYRLVRAFRVNMTDALMRELAGPCFAADEDFRAGWLPHDSAVGLELLRSQPRDALPSDVESWDGWMLSVVERCVREARASAGSLEAYRWGARNTVRLRHPLTYAVPALMRWFALPSRELPGGSFMPRVQHPRHGASERMVVAPGHEEDALLHMPGGQSGHPFSRYFAAGNRAWEEGEPTLLLVGETVHALELVGKE